MNKKTLHVTKSSLKLLKMCLIIILLIELVDITVDMIMFMARGELSSDVSYGNIISVFMICAAVILPVHTLKKFITLGCSRNSYFFGTTFSYILIAFTFSIFNLLWYYFENGLLFNYRESFNIIDIFGWTQHGIIGLIIYQFTAYLLLMVLVNLFFTCINSNSGKAFCVFIMGAIAILTSIGGLRAALTKILISLIANPSLLMGTILSLSLSAVLSGITFYFTRHINVSK